MGVATEPKPAQLPLAGGRAGACVRLHPLLTGETLVTRSWLERPRGPLARKRAYLSLALARRARRNWVPVPAFLLEHPSAGALLVDTGLHASVAHDPGGNLGAVLARFKPVRTDAEQSADHQLRRRGVEPEQVRAVIMTHLHADHASAVISYPQATFLVDGAEWEAAGEPRGSLRGYHPLQFDHAFDWRTIDYGAREISSFAGFARTVDVFGDGSVRLLSTPGHSRGHQSVLLRLRDREALLTGDAALAMRTIDDDLRPAILDDEHRYRRSLREIRRYREQTPDALVIPGHDAEAFAALDDAY